MLHSAVGLRSLPTERCAAFAGTASLHYFGRHSKNEVAVLPKKKTMRDVTPHRENVEKMHEFVKVPGMVMTAIAYHERYHYT
jgi:hypothetical protein